LWSICCENIATRSNDTDSW